MPLLLLLVLLPAVLLALTPVLLVQRYRVGTSRRPARRWIAWLGIVSTALSAVMLLVTAVFTNIWVGGAVGYSALGLACGCALGVLGLVMTRWEATARSLHYTPSRLLVLFVTLLVTARVLLGLYRSFLAAEAGISGRELATAFGIDESLGAGGVVIGYYLVYHVGLVWRIRRWDRRTLRVMERSR